MGEVFGLVAGGRGTGEMEKARGTGETKGFRRSRTSVSRTCQQLQEYSSHGRHAFVCRMSKKKHQERFASNVLLAPHPYQDTIDVVLVE